MNRRAKYLLAVAGLAILTVGISNSHAGPGRITSLQSAQKQSAQNQDESFHAVLTGVVSVKLTDNPCVDSTVVKGEGTEDRIGRISFETRALLLRPGRSSCPLVGSGAPPESIDYDFFTDTSGDTLFGTHNAIRQPQLPDGSSLWKGTFRFSGGTGHFKGAMGEGEFSVTFPPGSQTGTAVFDGEIILQATQNDHN